MTESRAKMTTARMTRRRIPMPNIFHFNNFNKVVTRRMRDRILRTTIFRTRTLWMGHFDQGHLVSVSNTLSLGYMFMPFGSIL
jgi:hypothetical protein